MSKVESKDVSVYDPLKLKEFNLNNDFYTLSWFMLRKDIWYDCPKNGKKLEEMTEEEKQDDDNFYWRQKTLGGKQICLTDSNVRNIAVYMTLFITIVLFVLIGIIHQIFTGEIKVTCPWTINILRMLLVCLVQMKLFNEFKEGLIKFKFAYFNPEDFTNPGLAYFISISKVITTLLSWSVLVIFMATENEPLDMIQDFTGICVFTELDDWIGSYICSTEIKISEEDEKYYNFDDINEKLSLENKMSMIQFNTTIIENLNGDHPLRSIVYSIYNSRLILFFTPLIVIPIEWLFMRYHPRAE